MAKVIGTKGNIVSVKIFGVSQVMIRLKAAKIKVFEGADFGVVRAGTFVEEEVKESIMGNRVESKSVDTGHFVKDVIFNKIGKAVGKVHAPNTPYAGYVEHSTRISGGPRHHFRNTEKRTKGKVRDIIKSEIGRII